MRNIYNKLMSILLDGGYKITNSDKSGTEAQNKNGIVFSTMQEDNYFEAALYLADNDAVVSYDILSSEYQTDIFVDNPITQEKTSIWYSKLVAEVNRLELENYKM